MILVCSMMLCIGIKGYGCANVPLQQGQVKVGFNPPYYLWLTCDHVVTKLLDVAAAEFGLGAFSTQSIKKGAFIGGNVSVSRCTCRGPLNKSPEYVGEIYHTFDHTSRTYGPNRFSELIN